MLHLDHKIINWNAHDDSHFQSIASNSSPTDDHSSPLSPVPDQLATATGMPTLQHLNPHMALAEEKEAPLEIPQREEEEEDESALSPIHQQHRPPGSSDVLNTSSSRQSTPLSELSPPPDDDVSESTTPTTSNNNHLNNASVNGGREGGGGNARMMDRRSTESSMSATTATTTAAATRSISRNGMNSSFDHSASSVPSSVNGDAYATALPSSSFTSTSLSGSPTHSSSLSQSHHDLLPLTPSSSQDPRTGAVLDLNVDLLRCVASSSPVMRQFTSTPR
jgi:hypothetical protein